MRSSRRFAPPRILAPLHPGYVIPGNPSVIGVVASMQAEGRNPGKHALVAALRAFPESRCASSGLRDCWNASAMRAVPAIAR
jgi:hypothetical protein